MIAFKGPVLALQAWGDLALRQFNDLDLLVHPGDAARTVEVLIADGYTALTFDRQHPERSIARRCEDEFMRPDSAAMIDLHWELNPSYFAYGPMGHEVWTRGESRRIEGVDVKSLGPADLVLFQAVHATKHGWINLGWICDFNAAMRALPQAEMSEVAEAARRSGCLRMLLLAIALAADVLDAPIPPEFSDAIRRDAAIAALTAGIERRLFATIGLRAQPDLNGWCRFEPSRGSAAGRGFLRVAHSPRTSTTLRILSGCRRRSIRSTMQRGRCVFAWQQSRRLFVDVPHPLKRLPGASR